MKTVLTAFELNCLLSTVVEEYGEANSERCITDQLLAEAKYSQIFRIGKDQDEAIALISGIFIFFHCESLNFMTHCPNRSLHRSFDNGSAEIALREEKTNTDL